MHMRPLFIALLTCCIGLITQPVHAQAKAEAGSNYKDLYEELGFNVPCPGATERSCSTPLRKVNAGTCFIYACDDAVLSDTGEQCPVYSECATSDIRTESVDNNGCPVITCSPPKLCVTLDMVTCPTGQTAIDTGIKDDAKCPIFSCVIPSTLPNCPEQMNCPPGSKQSNLTVDPRGCTKFECEKVVCPIQNKPICKTGEVLETYKDKDLCTMTRCVTKAPCPVQQACATGTVRKDLPSTDGCPKFECVRVSPTAPVCPEQMNCPPGSKQTNIKKDAKGCTTFECTKVSPTAPVCPSTQANCPPGSKQTNIKKDAKGCVTFDCTKISPTTPVCPSTQANCPPGYKQTDIKKDANGCTTFKCADAKGCVAESAPTCKTGEITETYFNQTGCKLKRCIKDPKCEIKLSCPPGFKSNGETYVIAGCTRTGCMEDKPACPVQENCPTGTVRKNLPSTDGCKKFTCEKVECPVQENCPTGTVRKNLPSTDGCKKFTCEKVECPVQEACATGYKKTDEATDKNGCKTFRCRKDTSKCDSVGWQGETGSRPRDANTKSCPAGTAKVVERDANGCESVRCIKEEKECPVQANCPTGYTRKNANIDGNGCRTFSCEKLCPQQANCPTGYKQVKGKIVNGCQMFSCEKIDTTPVKTTETAGCRVSTNNAGCSSVAKCPAGKKIVGIKAACNLEYGKISNDTFDDIKFGSVKVVRASDRVQHGSCKVGNVDITSGSAKLSVASLGITNSVNFACKERDNNGGDCQIRVAVECQ